MPMGLMNTLAIFMRTMNNLLVDMLDKVIVVFLYNIVIYSTIVEEHVKLLEKVFACLHKHEFYCKLKKCNFPQRSTTFLGFDITTEGLKIGDTKL